MFSESNQIKVLVADDNREFCGILKSYFTNDPDFQLIDVCTNGMEVINVLQKEEVEVFTDQGIIGTTDNRPEFQRGRRWVDDYRQP
jgi:CheY-like chemotaxis protein